MSKRNSYLIDSKVQWALVRHMMMHWCLMLLALVSVGVLVELMFGPRGGSFAQAIGNSFGKQMPLIIMMFMLVPMYVWDLVKLSHRFAGPMRRLRTILRSMAGGGTGGKLKFRPGDFWQETAEDFNAFYQKHLELQQRCEVLEQQIHDLNASKAKSAV